MERHLVTGAHWGLKQHGENSLEDTGAVHKMDWMSLSMLVLFWMCSVSILRIQGLSQPASCNVMQRACSRTFRDAVAEQLARWFLRQKARVWPGWVILLCCWEESLLSWCPFPLEHNPVQVNCQWNLRGGRGEGWLTCAWDGLASNGGSNTLIYLMVRKLHDLTCLGRYIVAPRERDFKL